MTVPASRNLNQCTKSFPGTESSNACLANQDRSSAITGACEGLPCWGCNKLPKPPYHLTCTPGNHPGVYKIQNNVCGVSSKSILFGPNHGPDFQRDDPQVTWQAGSVVEVEVMYLANHLGNYQFRLCLDGSDTDECFNQMPLKFEDGQDWHWIPEIFMNIHAFGRRHRKDRIVLPEGVECDHCTLNWRWDTAQEASVFSNCADVAITSSRDHALDITHIDPFDAVNVVTSDGLCLDIPGGNVSKGQPLWIWECSGTDTQQFTFHEGTWRSWRITPASDPSLCIDTGDMSMGNQIMLQECNKDILGGQQNFGYNSEVQSLPDHIYLASSRSGALCWQPDGAWNSAGVFVTDCQEQNPFQQWSLNSSTFSGLRVVSNQTRAEAWI